MNQNISIKPLSLRALGLLLIFCFVSPFAFGKENFKNHFEWEEYPEIPPPPGQDIQAGLAAPFAGVSNNVVLVGGGANFPNKAVELGGKKIYHQSLFVLQEEKGDKKWKKGLSLPYPVAYGASITTPHGVVCAGGKNDTGDLKKVFLLNWNSKKQDVDLEFLPDLPFTMTNMAGAFYDGKVYLAAGVVDGGLANKFLTLDLTKKRSKDWKWEELPPFPGAPRIQPVASIQNNGEKSCFYLISGSCYPQDEELPLVQCDGWSFDLKSEQWEPISPASNYGKGLISFHGGYSIPMGAHHIMVIGGVDREIFTKALIRERKEKEARDSGYVTAIQMYKQQRMDYLSQPEEAFAFNRAVMVYHTLTDTWTKVADYPFTGPAGAPIVKWKNGWLVINGEVKPGVRTPRVCFGKVVNEPVFGAVNWIVLVVYLLGMLWLGFYFMRRERSTEDFFKGGGRIPWWAVGMSLFATMLSAITFMAIPAKTYATDWRYFITAVTIFIVSLPVIKYYLPFFRRLKLTTAYEYLEVRFSYMTRALASALFIVFMTARMALVLFLPSLALTVVTGIDIYTCIVLMGVITIIYCTMGGVEAVIWGDVIQGFVLVGGALVAVASLISGIPGGLDTLIDVTVEYEKMKTFDVAFDWTQPTLWVVLLGGMANNLISYSSDQTVIQRYMTTKSEKAAGNSILFNGVISVVVSFVFYFIGTAMFAFYKANPGELDIAMSNTDSIFPHFIMSRMPIGVAGLLIAAIFSATMSTVSSNINSISTAFTADFYDRWNPGADDHKRLRVARLAGIISGGLGVVFAILMAMVNILSLFDFFNAILGLLTAGLGGLFAMGIFSERVHAKGALTGFIISTILVFWLKVNTDISFMMYGVVGLVSSFVIGYFTSLVVPGTTPNLAGLTYKRLNEKP